MLILFQCTEEEAKHLIDVTERLIEEAADTKDKMIEDGYTLDTFDKFNETMQQHTVQTEMLERLHDKLTTTYAKEAKVTVDEQCVFRSTGNTNYCYTHKEFHKEPEIPEQRQGD